MSERMEQIGNWLSDNAPQVGIGAAAVLLLGIGYYFYTDMNAPARQVPPPPIQQLNTRLSDDNESFQVVAGTMLDTNPTISETANYRLVQLNMFDARSVQRQRERDREFDAQYARAEAAFVSEDLAEAERIVDSILDQNPLHHRAADLKNRIVRAQMPDPVETVEDPDMMMGDPMLNGMEGMGPGF